MGFTSAARRALITCASEEGPPRDGGAGRGGREPGQPGMPAFRCLVVPFRLPALDQPATTARSGTAAAHVRAAPAEVPNAAHQPADGGEDRQEAGTPRPREHPQVGSNTSSQAKHGDDHRDHAQPCPPARLVFSPGPLPATSGTGNRQRCRGCGGGRKVAGERAELALRGCREHGIEALVELPRVSPPARSARAGGQPPPRGRRQRCADRVQSPRVLRIPC